MSWAVWYHSAGCLPDGEDGPEFTGTEQECEDWVIEHAEDYDTSVLYNLYVEPYEPDAGLGSTGDLIAGVWKALDAGLSDAAVRDVVDQALHTWAPTDSGEADDER
jgi:hypothetical protein